MAGSFHVAVNGHSPLLRKKGRKGKEGKARSQIGQAAAACAQSHRSQSRPVARRRAHEPRLIGPAGMLGRNCAGPPLRGPVRVSGKETKKGRQGAGPHLNRSIPCTS